MSHFLKGKLIVIEGIDGTGKNTQANILAKYMEPYSDKTSVISFPRYDSMSSGPVKMYLNGLLGDVSDVNAYSASLLFLADQVCGAKILEMKDKLEKGENIICDRYVESNMIHQLVKLHNDTEESKKEFIDWLNDTAYNKLKLPKPDLVILLDMQDKVSENLRLTRDKDRMRAAMEAGEEYKADIHERNESYLELCNKYAKIAASIGNWKVVKCDDNVGLLPPIRIRNKIIDIIDEEYAL